MTEPSMPAIATDIPDTAAVGEDERVFLWRVEQLRATGYPLADALTLAIRSDVDLHAATALVAAGCPVETALRILL